MVRTPTNDDDEGDSTYYQRHHALCRSPLTGTFAQAQLEMPTCRWDKKTQKLFPKPQKFE